MVPIICFLSLVDHRPLQPHVQCLENIFFHRFIFIFFLDEGKLSPCHFTLAGSRSYDTFKRFYLSLFWG